MGVRVEVPPGAIVCSNPGNDNRICRVTLGVFVSGDCEGERVDGCP